MTRDGDDPPHAAVLAVVVAGFFCALQASAQPPAGEEEAHGATPAPPWYERVALNGFVSASWGYAFDDPASGTNPYRCFDTEAGPVLLDVASVAVRREAAERGETGFRIDVLAGSTVPPVTAADGLFRDEDGKAGSFDLLQAWVRWVAPVGRGLKLDAGKFVTRAGYEVLEGFEGRNANASRSFQFTLSEPTTHTGLRAGYALSETLSAELLLVNGWDDAKDRNGRKTLGAGLDLATPSGWTVSATLLHGPEREGNDADDRTLLAVSAEWAPGGPLGAAANLELGREEGLGAGGSAVSWWGLAGYVTWAASPAVVLALRAELFDDPDGARTGMPQRLFGLTLTPALGLAKGLLLRTDLRLDVSDEAVYEDAAGELSRKRQATLLLNLSWAF